MLIFFFGLLQPALLYTARLVVRNAAQRAVRSAVVVLEDDPATFDQTPHPACGTRGHRDCLPAECDGVLGPLGEEPNDELRAKINGVQTDAQLERQRSVSRRRNLVRRGGSG